MGLLAPSGASAEPSSRACNARATDTPKKLLPCIRTDDLWNHMKAFQAIADANPGLDGHPSRNSGEPGYWESAQYVKRKMKAAGYDVKLQPYTFTYTSFVGTPTWSESSPTSRSFTLVDDWNPGSSNGTVTNAQVQPAGGIVIPPDPSGSTSTSGCTSADFSGFTAGNIALIQRGGCNFGVKVLNATAAGASGVVIFNEGNPGRTAVANGSMVDADGNPFVATIPVAFTSFDIGEQLYNESNSATPPHMSLDIKLVGGHPEVYGLLPAAVKAALDHDYALLKRLVFASRVGEVGSLVQDPTNFSVAAGAATSCHDYPRPYDLAAPPADRRRQYRRALAALDPAQFRPFSPRAWLSTGIDAGPGCLDWPADRTAGSPLQGRPLPDVPVLVQSGDLDSNTPVEQGRAAAAQFRHATFAVVANIGHTPDTGACGLAMALDFVEHLKTDANRCRRDGHPPTVIGRPARRAAELSSLPVPAAAPVRRAVGVALATIADVRMAAASGGLGGTLDALRGGTYVSSQNRVRIVSARVVTDAAADGTQTIGRRATRTRLRLRGPGVPPAQLTLRSAGTTTRITGTVAGRRVALRIASTH